MGAVAVGRAGLAVGIVAVRGDGSWILGPRKVEGSYYRGGAGEEVAVTEAG